MEPDKVRDRSSGVSVPDELRLDSDTRDADDDGSRRRRSPRSLLLLRLPLRRLGDGPSSSPETAPLTQQSSDLHGCVVVADIAV